jgi:hypothetical protein
MGKDRRREPESLDDTIERARTATRELHEAIADHKRSAQQTETRLAEALAAARTEIALYSRDTITQLLQRIADDESAHFTAQVRAATVAAQTQVAASCEALFARYMQQEIDDAPSPADVFEARRVLTRWTKNMGGTLPMLSFDKQGNLLDDQGQAVPLDNRKDQQ